jgi:hypothetical protein
MLVGESFESAVWQVDLNPGGKISSLVIPSIDELGEIRSGSDDGDGHLFTDILARAWSDLSGGVEPISAREIRKLVCVDLPDYGSEMTVIQPMTFGEQTGFTRNLPEDLRGPFGKAKLIQ